MYEPPCAVDAPAPAGMQWAEASVSTSFEERLMAETPSTSDPTQERETQQPAEIASLPLVGACGCGSGCGCGCQSGAPCQCG
ncbi:hypothetical protein SY2F82_46500 [Streptomyces sp. Y2F8-2]|nr:hypothetical protein SY2F82_46500 [Streptomyces sp. Y2F8-2]